MNVKPDDFHKNLVRLSLYSLGVLTLVLVYLLYKFISVTEYSSNILGTSRQQLDRVEQMLTHFNFHGELNIDSMNLSELHSEYKGTLDKLSSKGRDTQFGTQQTNKHIQRKINTISEMHQNIENWDMQFIKSAGPKDKDIAIHKIQELKKHTGELIFLFQDMFQSEKQLVKLGLFSLLTLNVTLLTFSIYWTRKDEKCAEEREQKLKKNEERYLLVTEGSSDGFWDWTLDDNEVHFSPHFRRLLGYESSEFPNKFESWESKLHPDDIEHTMQAVESHLAQKGPYDVEYRLKTKHSGYRWFRAKGQARWSDRGEPIRMSGSITDINENKELREKLIQREAHLDAVLRNAVDPIIAIADDGKVLSFNQAAESTFGWTEQEMLGRNVNILMPSPLTHQHDEFLKEYKRTGKKHIIDSSREVTGLHKNGALIPLELGVSEFSVGEKVFYSGVARNISERKVWEKEVLEAREQAIEISKMKSEFLANMSHEIRTPLNSIIGLVDLINGASLDKKTYEYMLMVKESSNSLLHIINEVLDFSKIEAGKMQVDEYEFDLFECVENATLSLNHLAYKKGIELTCNVGASTPRIVVGDAVRIRQVLINLISNALKFTSSGEVNVRASVLHKNQSKRLSLLFEVEDTGIGIEPAQIKQLFTPFYQVNATSTRKTGGTGLGLTISQKLVELMGGELLVRSELNRGTTFSFILELEKSDQIVFTGNHSMISSLKILIVDDNATNRKILRQYLTNLNFECDAVSSALKAITQLSNAQRSDKPFDVVLIDQNMPDLSGIELAKLIKDKEEFTKLRMILLSSLEVDEGMKGLELFESYITKPVRQSKLFDILLNNHKKSNEQNQITIPNLTGFKALVVDDMKANQIVASEILKQCGISVCMANNGEEAISQTINEDFDIILMDCQMPQMDGFAATHLIRANEEKYNKLRTPIIALTAHALEGDSQKCLDAGMDAYLSKPFKQTELINLLKIWLEESTEPLPKDAEIKHQELTVLLNMSPESFEKLIGHVDEDVNGQLQKLEQAIQTNDIASVRSALHALKGVFSNIDAHDLANICDFTSDDTSNDAFELSKLLEKITVNYQSLKKQFVAIQLTHSYNDRV